MAAGPGWPSLADMWLEASRSVVKPLKPKAVDEAYISWWNEGVIQAGFNPPSCQIDRT